MTGLFLIALSNSSPINNWHFVGFYKKGMYSWVFRKNLNKRKLICVIFCVVILHIVILSKKSKYTVVLSKTVNFTVVVSEKAKFSVVLSIKGQIYCCFKEKDQL